jgi:hypothetical protein
MAIRKVYKLVDKSIVLGTEVESNDLTVTIQIPLNMTQIHNPQTGEPEIAFLPMDLIFADATESKNVITLKQSQIMWDKDLADFPNYDQNYVHQTTGIETVSSGIIKG